MIKQISLLYRPEGMSREEFRKYWVDVHAEMVKVRLPGLRKYVGSFAIDPPDGERFPAGGEQMDCDAVIELHFDDMGSYLAAMSSPQWLGGDRKNSTQKVLDGKKLRFLVADEVIVPL
jgi:uncharacterized protein (TIGR02118 family)